MSQQPCNLQTDLPWVRGPLIVSPPCRPYAGVRLSCTVSSAGGLGFMAYDPKHTDGDVSQAAAQLTTITSSASTRPPSNLLPMGIGYLIFQTGTLAVARRQISTYRPCAVWLYAPATAEEGGPDATLETWAAMIRETCPQTRIWVQVGSVSGALAAVRACAPSRIVLVAQGLDAGGHGLAEGAGVVTLVPEMQDALAAAARDYTDRSIFADRIPVLAAGGIAEARGAAAALALGADGVVMGTRFMATRESAVPAGFREAIVAAADGGQSTLRTRLFDRLRGTKLGGAGGWPLEYDGRGLRNRSSEDFERRGEGAFADLKRAFDEQAAEKRPERFGVQGRDVTYAGTGVGLIKSVVPAAQVVDEVRSGAVRILQNVATAQRDAKL